MSKTLCRFYNDFSLYSTLVVLKIQYLLFQPYLLLNNNRGIFLIGLVRHGNNEMKMRVRIVQPLSLYSVHDCHAKKRQDFGVNIYYECAV